jgi:hypothetical protein
MEALKRTAHDRLRIGTKRDEVIRFFAENGIPLTIEGDDASVSILTSGCSPFGCGSDAFLLGVRVKLDEAGNVKSEPDVGGIYTDCL